MRTGTVGFGKQLFTHRRVRRSIQFGKRGPNLADLVTCCLVGKQASKAVKLERWTSLTIADSGRLTAESDARRLAKSLNS